MPTKCACMSENKNKFENKGHVVKRHKLKNMHKFLGGGCVKGGGPEPPFTFHNPPAGDKITNLKDW